MNATHSPSHAQWRRYLSQLFTNADGATQTLYDAIERADPHLQKAAALAVSAMESTPAGKHGNCLNVLQVSLRGLLDDLDNKSKYLVAVSSEDAIKAWRGHIYNEIQSGKTHMPISQCYTVGMNQLINHGSIASMLHELKSDPAQRKQVVTQLQYALLSRISGSVIANPKSPAYDSLRLFYNKLKLTKTTYGFATWFAQLLAEYGTLLIVGSLLAAATCVTVSALGGARSVACLLSNTLTTGWAGVKKTISAMRSKYQKQEPKSALLVSAADDAMQDVGGKMAEACPAKAAHREQHGCHFDGLRPCEVVPSKGGYSVIELRAMAPKCGIPSAAAKTLKKAGLCAALRAGMMTQQKTSSSARGKGRRGARKILLQVE